MNDKITAAGGWCAPSETLYETNAVAYSATDFLAPATCPAANPDESRPARACVRPDRADIHGDGHLDFYGRTWPVTEREQLRWTHDCPRPDPTVAWKVMAAAGLDVPDIDVPCPDCGALWSLVEDTCGECGTAYGNPSWHRWPPEGGAWDGTFAIDRGGIIYPVRKVLSDGDTLEIDLTIDLTADQIHRATE